MSNDFSLALSTALAPTKKFTVDGTEYEMLGLAHLSPDDESEVMALFARFGLLSMELEGTSNVERGKEVANRLKATRFRILTKLTSLPRDVAEKLPLTEQARLMEAIEEAVTEDAEPKIADDGSPLADEDDES